MRKLAPLFLMTSLAALGSAPILANTGKTSSSTPPTSIDSTATSSQALSYTNKVETTPGISTTAKDTSSSVAAMTDEERALEKAKTKKKLKKVAKSDKSNNPVVDQNPPATATSLTNPAKGDKGS